MKPKNLILHPSCPKKLITALRRAKGENGKGWNFSVLSRQLGVNKGVIHKLVTKGIEPRGEELRLKVFLTRHPRKRYGDCNRCGKPVTLMQDGTLESHVRPDGTYCPGSDTRDFLHASKQKPRIRKELPKHIKWWRSLSKDKRSEMIMRLFLFGPT